MHKKNVKLTVEGSSSRVFLQCSDISFSPKWLGKHEYFVQKEGLELNFGNANG